MVEVHLTAREFQVLLGACQGMSRGKIAEQYDMTFGTVNTHLRSLYKKLGAHTEFEAATRAWRLGVLRTCPICRRNRSVAPDHGPADLPQHPPIEEEQREVVRPGGLAQRHQQTLELIAHGCETAEIAARMYVTPHTVRTNVARLFHRLGVSNRAQAVAQGFARGYLNPEDYRGTDGSKG